MVGEVRLAMEGYFGRLIEEWKKTNSSLPKAPWNEEASQFLYVGKPDEEEWVEWRPMPRSDAGEDFAPLELELGVALPPSVKEYFSSYWFCSLGGRYAVHPIQLQAVIPGVGLRDYRRNLMGYREAHGRRLDRVPIGVETRESLLVVVDRSSERVELEDYDAGRFDPLARTLAELIEGLI